jgi:CheY-like chemotaxis protein
VPDIRVLVVDDHPVVRQGLRSFLDVQPDITVVGEAADGAACVAAAEELRPTWSCSTCACPTPTAWPRCAGCASGRTPRGCW